MGGEAADVMGVGWGGVSLELELANSAHYLAMLQSYLVQRHNWETIYASTQVFVEGSVTETR